MFLISGVVRGRRAVPSVPTLRLESVRSADDEGGSSQGDIHRIHGKGGSCQGVIICPPARQSSRVYTRLHHCAGWSVPRWSRGCGGPRLPQPAHQIPRWPTVQQTAPPRSRPRGATYGRSPCGERADHGDPNAPVEGRCKSVCLLRWGGLSAHTFPLPAHQPRP